MPRMVPLSTPTSSSASATAPRALAPTLVQHSSQMPLLPRAQPSLIQPVAHVSPASSLPPPAEASQFTPLSAQPSADDIRQRAEYMRMQREIIVAKKKAERERQLEEHV